ncbi:MAG: hypothetical protein H6828_05435 [Planctomycetes bacterium]|nr:hypothetical protein [Planctomycetota bacterium]
MSDAARKCAQCGAAPKNVAAKYCEYCGAELPSPATPPVVGPHGDLEARFAALEVHDSLPRLMRLTPSTGAITTGFVVMIVFGVFFTAVALFMTGTFALLTGPFALFPLLFVAVGIFTVVKGAQKATAMSSAPMERVPVVILDERTQITGGGKNSSAHTSYFALVESASGERGEYQTLPKVAGKLSRGDVGVGYFKGEYLVDFQRVPV